MSLKAAYIVCHPPLIIPEIGKGEELKIKKTIDAYHHIAAEISRLKPKTIIIVSPHADVNYDYFHISPGKEAHGDFRIFGAPRVSFNVPYDDQLIEIIERKANQREVPAYRTSESRPDLDHGTMVPLYFIDQHYKSYFIVRLAPSMQSIHDHYIYGKAIHEAIIDYKEDVVLIASGDLSHVLNSNSPYGFTEEGPVFDQIVIEAIRNNDLKRLLTIDGRTVARAKPCGLSSFAILAGAIETIDTRSTLESYEGPFGVGYAMARFDISEDRSNMTEQQKTSPYVELARKSIIHYLTTGTYLRESSIITSSMLSKRAGVFVSLKKHGMLRGCIGTISPTKDHIAKEIIYNAVSAALHDPRFEPVTMPEFEQTDLSVDILGQAEPLESIQNHDVDRYGIIVTSGYKKGLLLPRIDSIKTAQSQLEIALLKAGISDDESYGMERFEVIRHQ